MIDTRLNAVSQVATAAYGRIGAGGAGDIADGSDTQDATPSFSASLQSAMQGAIDSGHAADGQTVAALNGSGSITEVVTAVSKAQLALQTTTVIRDRVVQAYQDIMRMSI